MDDRMLDRARGCAVGAAIGDALGMPLEFGPARPPENLLREMTAGRIPAGSFTDDTEMALALAESLLYRCPLDPADLADRFVAWAGAHPPDVGLHTRRVLDRIAAGEPWDEAVDAVQRAKPDSAGNGSLMRAWPVALAHWADLDALLVDSWAQSRVTHPHPDALAASAFFNATIYHLLRGKPPRVALIEASTLVRMSDGLWQAVESAAARPRERLRNTGWVRHTAEAAVWALLTTDSFEEAVVQAVNLGADADTTGAVVGALAGAAYGMAAIPARWREALRGEWPLGSGRVWHTPDFVALADRLVEAGAPAAG